MPPSFDSYENRAVIDFKTALAAITNDFARRNSHLFVNGKENISASLEVGTSPTGQTIFRLYYTVS